MNGLSCAGSGKTTTIEHKLLIMELVNGINPAKIVAVTFSRAGADEMKSRHKELCGKFGINSNIKIKTFHALYLEIMKMVS